MNRISKTQFSALLLINDVFVLFCLTGGISVITAAGFAVGTILQMIISIPLIMIYKSGKTLKDCGKIAEITALAGTLIWGGLLFSMLWSTGGIVFIPFEGSGIWGRLLITGLIALVCVYISSSGIKALARSAVIAAAMGAVCLAIVVVSALINSDIHNLEAADNTGFFREIIKGFALSGGLSSFMVLLSFTNGGVRRAAAEYFAGKAVITAIVVTTGVLVSGGIMEITDFPIASAAQLSQPFPVQRIDSLFLIVFSVFAVYSIAVQASAAEYLLAETIPFIKKYRCSFMLVIMAGIGFAFGGRTHYGIIFAVIAIAALITAPISCMIKKKVRS